jgi:DNA primase small subunit
MSESIESRTLQTKLWLKGLFEDYYASQPKINFPEAVGQREFGFGSFAKKIAIRHRAFKDEKELMRYIIKEAPAHINHSTARYEFPASEEMRDKGRIGTDLIFDIDVGDLNLKHDHEDGWVCEACFEALKGEARKLVEFLTDDFGFSEKELSVNFSGSRGYHVRIRNDKILALDDKARKEICSYLSLDMDLSELIYEREGMIFGPRPDQHGLKGRIAKTVIASIEGSGIDRKEQIIGQIRHGNWGAFPKGFGLKRVMEYAKGAAVKIPVDSKVTTDLTHMIRMPDTLHGGSSLVAKTVNKLEKFDPMEECFVFGDKEIEVEFVKATPKLTAKGQEFGPFKEGKIKLPEYLAAYLGAKERCVIVK